MDLPTIPLTAANLLNRVREFYLFLGVAKNTIAIKYFCKQAIITSKLIASPNLRVSIDFQDAERLQVNARKVNIEVLFQP